MLNGIVIAMTVAYPFVVYLSLDRLEPRYLALGILLMYALRTVLDTVKTRTVAGLSWIAVVGGLFALVVFALNSRLVLLFYPALVNLTMLLLFAYSLHRPPTVIERLARLSDPNLPPSGVAYTRKVTAVWVCFFALNGAIALTTALWGNLVAWSLYNGFISYVLMGILFVSEYLVRQRVRAAR